MICLAASAFGQVASSLRGTVIDAQGGVLPGVTVQLVNAQSGFNRTAITDGTGNYQFLQVPPGAYDVVSALEGFATVTNKVTLQVNTPASLDVKLGLANLSEAVTVTAEAALVNTVDASVGNAFREEQVRNLPLITRNVVELLSLQPGVTPTGEVVGARRDQNNVTLDGVDVNDNQTAGITTTGPGAGYNFASNNQFRESGFNAALPVPLDSVQEFRVTVAGQNADQGRSSGGQVTLVTKSGTNHFRGSAYEYNRDTKFSSNSWFSSRSGIAKEQLARNQYGVSAGGPIKRNRIFFFGNFERRTDDSASNQLRRVPSPTLRAGTIMARANDGRVYELGPAALKAIDPLGLGSSPAILSLLQALPAGNDPSAGLDGGLNFTGYRFNAPLKLDNRAYVGKVDVKLDRQSAHNLSVRTSIADASRDDTLAQYPGQDAASKQLNGSYGISAAYTGILSPTLVNSANFGLTRIDLQQTGSLETSFTLDSIDVATNYNRPSTRIAPTFNFIDDLTWTKGSHSVTAGANVRLIRNDRTIYTNAFQSFGFGRGSLLGLGSDIVNSTQSYLADLTGNPNIRLADAATVGRAFGNLFGVLTGRSMTYSYDQSGQAIPIGTPTVRNFASNEWEIYLADNWRATPNLTLSYGLRYMNLGAPYEQNGLQVGPTFPLQEFFAERLTLSQQGVPSNQMPHNWMTYDFNGPANGKASWFNRDSNNFAPRGGFAYTPTGGFLKALTGEGGVIRGGAGMTYDRFGSNLVTRFDTEASFGLSEIVRGTTPNFTTGARYLGDFPTIPGAPAHTFPFTAPLVDFIGGGYMGIDSSLHAPHSYNANLSITRSLGKGLTLEAGYLGRWSRDLLMQVDVGGWAVLWKDPATGQSWKEMATQIRRYHDAGVDPTAIRTNPNLVAPIPFVESMMPGLTNLYFPGSATANYYNLLWGQYGGSDADATHAIDRVKSAAFPNCIIKTGCNTLYPSQSSAMSMWTNAGYGNFNGGTFSLRKGFSNGYSFDVNYTLSHSQDNGGAAEAGAGTHGGIMLNPYNYDAFYGDSDFDIRHNLNVNALYELPIGHGRALMSNAGALTDAVVGGWQISGIFRYNSGLPTSVAYGGIWPTHFSVSAVAYPVAAYDAGVTTNQNGNPAIFASTTEAANWRPMYPGEAGTRAAVRLDDFMNTDLAITKSVHMGGTRRLQFRAEAFNAFNNVNFTNLSLDANSPASFGQFTSASPARVMQFALRYEF
jgi:hypothetical protein